MGYSSVLYFFMGYSSVLYGGTIGIKFQVKVKTQISKKLIYMNILISYYLLNLKCIKYITCTLFYILKIFY